LTTKDEATKLTLRQREGRAINAVAELLRKTLSVPNIYLEPPTALITADVLAVDRGGAGDLHAVQIKLERNLNPFEGQQRKGKSLKEINELYREFYPKYSQKLQQIHHQLMVMPAHYRYLAIPTDRFDLAFSELGHFGLFPKDGIGRLGIITITEHENMAPSAEIKLTPERFRIDPAKLSSIENRLLAKNRPDIEVRI
jgi:hypothetical protein